MNETLQKAIDEARIWTDTSGKYTDQERLRARKRFDYALKQIRLDDDRKPNPLEEIQLHVAVVDLARRTDT